MSFSLDSLPLPILWFYNFNLLTYRSEFALTIISFLAINLKKYLHVADSQISVHMHILFIETNPQIPAMQCTCLDRGQLNLPRYKIISLPLRNSHTT